MKKKGILVLLISTLVVVAVFSGLSISHVFSPAKNNSNNNANTVNYKAKNEGNNKGSEEDPYYIYDVESFNYYLREFGGKTKQYKEVVKIPSMIDVVNDDGETVQQQKVDENGELVWDIQKDEDGFAMYTPVEGVYEPYHFEIVEDIDFADVDYKMLFNDNTAFRGIINGKGHTLKNIKIKVTKANLSQNMYTKGVASESYIHVGVFGNLNSAKITNLKFDALNVKVDNEVYTYLQTDDFWADNRTAVKEITVGAVAACAENSTLEVDVNATIDADGYGVFVEDKIQGINGVGGVVGYANNSVVRNTKKIEEDGKVTTGTSKVKLVADSRPMTSYMGGVAGYAVSSELDNVYMEVEVVASAVVKSETVYNKIYIGGLVGYAYEANIHDSSIDLNVVQLNSEERISGKGVTKVDNGKYHMVAGIVSIVRADREEPKDSGKYVGVNTEIKRVRTNSNVDMDCLFAGAVFEVKSRVLEAEYNQALAAHNTYEVEQQMAEYVFVTLEDLTIKSYVNTLKAFGIAFKLLYTDIVYSEDYVPTLNNNAYESEKSYNVYLGGKTSYAKSEDMTVTGVVCTNSTHASVHVNLSDIKLMISLMHQANFELVDQVRVNMQGKPTGFGSVSFVD